ncbi:helix-turn-helix transcriptional regulator [Clostridium sp. WLY-B-L2]|jgi:putative transcriptional regulator|uniref:Helix-turn-helix transcriptional regulator n=1 Tax=Clostridium aromativorans TaxID=2836848 RepID=A0ABS8NA61_9CLOT|nr:helix-turn-helix transcriptional regulator [Clostridium aromativorans]MCC9296536.1 helix-turn-helix transcriptional regulator [Clostridium aromativorans]
MNSIKAIKKKLNLTYRDLEKQTGLSAMYICYLAEGKRTNPSLEVMQKISSALGKKVEEVFKLN